MGLCSVTVLLGTALLLLAPGSTQAVSSSSWKDVALEQDLAEEIILGVEAIEDGEPGIKVLSSSAWAQWGSPQIQARPEGDRDLFQHLQDYAREANDPVPFGLLSLEVQNGPEEDRDYLYHPYHPEDDAREADTYRPARMLSLKVQNGPEEDRDHIYHS